MGYTSYLSSQVYTFQVFSSTSWNRIDYRSLLSSAQVLSRFSPGMQLMQTYSWYVDVNCWQNLVVSQSINIKSFTMGFSPITLDLSPPISPHWGPRWPPRVLESESCICCWLPGGNSKWQRNEGPDPLLTKLQSAADNNANEKQKDPPQEVR